jgi:hypothetical protein
MSLLRLSLRSVVFVLACCAALLFNVTSARGEKVPKPDGKPIEAKEGKKKAEVFWGSKWYPAEVLEEKDGKFNIRYDGYSDAYNEWVGKDRIRFPGKPKGETKCEVLWSGKWYPAQVIGEEDGKWKIKYDSYDDTWNEWVDKDRIRFPAKAAAPKKAEVFWGSKWYPATLLEEKDGKFHIKYDDYTDAWNEWVGEGRIRFPKSDEKKAAAAKVSKQTKCEVFWSTTWFPAEVLDTKDGKYYIKYDGYGDNWNEWVGLDRIRFPEIAKPTGKPGEPGNKDKDEKQPNGQN